MEAEYRAFHDLPTASPEGVVFYSGVSCRAYRADRKLAADAITAQATHSFDFPAVVEQAYADGIRVFLEVGPGGSCTRLVGRILADRTHLACSVCLPDRDPLGTVLEAIGSLIASRVPVSLEPLYGRPTLAVGLRLPEDGGHPGAGRRITIEVGTRPLHLPNRPRRAAETPMPSTAPADATALSQTGTTPILLNPLTRQLQSTAEAHAGAHEAFLRVARGFEELIGRNLEHQLGLIESSSGDMQMTEASPPRPEPRPPATPGPPRSPSSADREIALDRGQCLEFAVGSIAAVLGPEFAAIDAHPTRVRLPDEPLMLVDRIVTIEGEPRSLTAGRVVTEHDILPGAWYLDCRHGSRPASPSRRARPTCSSRATSASTS